MSVELTQLVASIVVQLATDLWREASVLLVHVQALQGPASILNDV